MSELNQSASGPEAAWRGLVEKALKGASFESLTSETADGLQIAPAYFSADAPALGILARPASHVDVRAICAATDPDAANRTILSELEGGATSIALQIESHGQHGLAPTQQALETALDGVDLTLAQVWLQPGEAFEAGAAALEALWREAKAGAAAKGGFGSDPLGALARTGGLDRSVSQSLDAMAALAGRTFRTHPEVRAVTVDAALYHDAGAGEADELACLAATFICYLRAMEEGRLAPEDAFHTTAFKLAVDADLLLSIAKLRAAQLVLARIAETSDAVPRPVWLEAVTARRMLTRHDPYTNMLRMTIASAAAIMGGADAVIVRPHAKTAGSSDGFPRRIARNIPIILQEESHLANVADPASGSFALDQLTEELAEKAWARLREIEAAGGIAAALQSGMIQSRIRETAERRAQKVSTGKITLIGINQFAQPDDAASEDVRPLPSALDNPAVTIEPLPLRRPSDEFERLRDASDAFLKRTGARPSIFLATLGSQKEFAARAGFASDFFASGGIASIEPGPLDTASAAAEAFRQSGAPVACLCASDETYDGLAEPVAQALKSAGVSYLLLAGRPGEKRQALRDAGVDGFIHMGCDRLAILTEILDRLGARTAS